MRKEIRWERQANGILEGHIVRADTPDSTGLCPMCRRRHRVDLVAPTNMNTVCFELYQRLRPQPLDR